MTSVLPPSVAPKQQKPTLSDTHPFTCNACQVAFRSSDSQRTHYHTDWHQYNLKRKVASLPPLSSETFAEKVLRAQANTRLEREKATFERTCKACNKTFFSENSYANHVGSQRHRQNVATMQMNAIRAGGSGRSAVSVGATAAKDEKDEAGSIVSSTFSLGDPVGEEGPQTSVEKKLVEKTKNLEISKDATAPPEASPPSPKVLPLEACLFCNYMSPSLTLNVSHMTKAHGLFIPEANYLVDLTGLISYLGKKLVLGNQCLYCGRAKGGLDGVRTHMQDKGHTMLGFETEEQQIELGQFYDFRSTYSDAGEESSSSDEAHASKARANKGKDWEVVEGGADADGWETDSSVSSLDSTELTSVPIDPSHPPREKHRHHMQDGWHSHAHHVLYHDDYELHLPSGRSVGHRSLARYYKQNLRDHPLQDKNVRRLADTPYPRGAPQSDDEDDDDNDDESDGGVEVENTERALNRRERRVNDRTVVRRGEAGMAGVSAATKKEVKRMAARARDRENRGRRREEWAINKKANSHKHCGDPVLQ